MLIHNPQLNRIYKSLSDLIEEHNVKHNVFFHLWQGEVALSQYGACGLIINNTGQNKPPCATCDVFRMVISSDHYPDCPTTKEKPSYVEFVRFMAEAGRQDALFFLFDGMDTFVDVTPDVFLDTIVEIEVDCECSPK